MLDNRADTYFAAVQHLRLAADVDLAVGALAYVALLVVVEKVKCRLLAHLKQTEADAELFAVCVVWVVVPRNNGLKQLLPGSQAQARLCLAIVADDGVRLAAARMAIGKEAASPALEDVG